MLRFFRQIRKTLMEQSKIRSYLLYATGEVFLVVLGILIALQVNNWNQDRQLHVEEQRYVSELIADLRQDSVALQSLHDEAVIIGRSKTILTDYLNDPTQVPDSLPTHFYNQWFSIQRFTPVATTIEEIRSGVGLAVIRNHELRRSIVNLYSDYEQWEVEDAVFQANLNIFFNLSRKQLPNINALSEQNVIALLKNMEVSNVLRTNYANGRRAATITVLESNLEVLGDLRKYQKEIN